MKLLQSLKAELGGIIKPLSESCEENPSSNAEGISTYIKVSLIADIMTLLLGLITLIGFIWRLLDSPIYVFFMISMAMGAVFLILLILAKRSKTRMRFVYISILFLAALTSLIIIYTIFFQDKPHTIYLPNPIPK